MKLSQLWNELLDVIHAPSGDAAKRQAMQTMQEAISKVESAAPTVEAVATAVGHPEIASVVAEVAAVAGGLQKLTADHQTTVQRLQELTDTVAAITTKQ